MADWRRKLGSWGADMGYDAMIDRYWCLGGGKGVPSLEGSERIFEYTPYDVSEEDDEMEWCVVLHHVPTRYFLLSNGLCPPISPTPSPLCAGLRPTFCVE